MGKLVLFELSFNAGPAVQADAVGWDGSKIAVLPVAPTANSLPLGSRIAGPISATWPEHACGSVFGVAPALTHLSVAGRYFSVFLPFEHWTVTTLPSGISVNVSSEQESPLAEVNVQRSRSGS